MRRAWSPTTEDPISPSISGRGPSSCLHNDLGFWYKCRNRVDDNDVDGTAAHKCIHNLKSLLSRIRLRDQKILGIDAQLARILRVEGVLGVDESSKTTCLLCLGNHM